MVLYSTTARVNARGPSCTARRHHCTASGRLVRGDGRAAPTAVASARDSASVHTVLASLHRLAVAMHRATDPRHLATAQLVKKLTSLDGGRARTPVELLHRHAHSYKEGVTDQSQLARLDELRDTQRFLDGEATALAEVIGAG